MACINPNSPEFKAALKRTGNPLLAEIEVDKGVQIKPGVEELFDSTPELANAVYEALGFTGAISLKSNLKNTGKTEQDLIDYLKKKYPEIKLNITNNPVWEKGKDILNQIIENEMGEEYWRNLYTQKNISNREEFESVKIPTIKNKFKPDFENVYHGTNSYEIDNNGNLILTPSKNFDGKTTSISFTQIPVVAQDYMLRKEGNIIIKINNEALGSNYDIESAEEIAVNGNQLFIVPKGQYEIITVPTLAEKMRRKYANEVEIRAEELINNAKSDLDLIDAIYSERIAADNYSELQEYGDVDISEQAPEWYVPDEYLDSRAAKKVYEDIRSKINKEWVINTLSNVLIEQIKNTGDYIASIEGALNDISTYGGRYAPHQSTLFEELLNEIGLGYFQRSTYLKEGEKLEKAKQKQKEYNELIYSIENLVEKEAEKSVKHYNSPEQVKLREEQRKRDKINREITENLTGGEIDELPFQKIGDRIIGQANIKAMTVLVDAVNKKADTIPHEYAHHYIAWFRNTSIVQEGIKRWGSEEALVQAIGEQVVKQKGEAYNWWKKFTNFILRLLSDKQLLQVLTDSFLNRTDLSSDFTYNQITPQQKQQAQQLYSQYLDTVFPDSKVKDIVYHGITNRLKEKFDKFSKEFIKSGQGRYGEDGFFFSENKEEVNKNYNNSGLITAIINLKNTSGDIYKNTWKETVEYLTEPQEIYGGKTDLDYLSEGYRAVAWYKEGNWKKQVERLKEDGWKIEETSNSYIKLGKISPQEKTYYSHLKKNLEKGTLPFNVNNSVEAIRKAKEQGLDGLIYENVLEESSIDKHNQYVVFEPEQIHILGGKQDIEGFKKFVGSEGQAMLQKPDQGILFQLRGGTMGSNASPKTISMIKDFLTRIGVSTKAVDNIVVNGVQMDANAAAIVTQKLIQVVNGMEARALPEEAMHFAVEIIKQTNPKLYQKLLNEINSYQILRDTFAEYSNNPLYQTKDGRPNVLKIKDEAIAKVLSETIIYQSENNKESAEKLAKVQSWWKQILERLKALFSRSGFDQAAMDIISGKEIGTADDIRANDNEVFLQQSKQEQVFNKIKAGSMAVEKRGDGYYVNDKKVPRRVTDLVNDWYERRFREKKLTDSEFQKAIDSMKADKGTAGHADLEYAFKVYVDPQTGLIRPEPLDDSGYVSELNNQDRKYYTILRDNLKKRLDSFGPNTRFLAEAVVYDAKRPGGGIAGTIDFIAIQEDGKVNILDWKFTNLNTNKYEDIPWYKVNAWRTQMNQYKLILKTAYGIKEDQFGQTRMIPIQAIYTEADYKKEILPRLSGIRIGDVDIKNIQEDYLLPVGLEEEVTGEEELDDLLAKLNNIYKKISEKKVTPGEKLTKAEQLNALYKAIRHLQMRRDAKALVYQARLINKQVEDIFIKFNDKFKGRDPNSFIEKERSDFTKEIDDGLDALDTYSDLATELDFLFRGELDKATEDVKNEIYKASSAAKLLRSRLLKLDKMFTNDFIALSEKVAGVKEGEKTVTGATKWFSSTATLQLKAAHVLFRKANRAFTYAGMDTAAESRRLAEIKKRYDDWAKARGLSSKNYFDIIRKRADSYQREADARRKADMDELNKMKTEISDESYKLEIEKINQRYENAIRDKNQLIDEFDPQFYSKLKSAIDQKDYKWIRDNVDKAAYAEHLRKKLDEEESRIFDKVRIGTEEDIANQIKTELRKAKELYNISTDQSVGWLLYDEVKQFPNKETWESKEWKELTKKDASGKFINQPAIDFYNYIRERNEIYRDIGYINAKQSRVFLPWVRKGLTEKLVLGGNVTVGEQFLKTISIDEGDVGYGQRDPISGKLIDKVPIYFTRELEGDVSTDLFRTMSLYNEFALRYKYLSDIEDQVLALNRLEKNKRSIATSFWGKTEYKDGELQYNPDNSENAKIIEDMTKAILYQQKFIQSDTFDMVLGKIGSVGENINKKLGFKLVPEGLAGRQISMNKSIDALNTTFQLQALGLNVLSSMSNLFGGTTQSLINSGRYFTKGDFVKAEGKLLWNKLGGEDAKKFIAAKNFFMPFTENYNRDLAKSLSMSKVSQESIQDFLMVLMRNSDRAVQAVNFYAFLENSVVIDDQVVNVREYLRQQPEYMNKMYEGTREERKTRADKFEQDVQKLIEEKGVMKLGKIEGDQFVIPGVDQKSESVVEFRRKVQQVTADALGNMSEANKRLINLNVYSNSFMVFKNWIPRLIDVRFGNLKYNSASDAYEWGRMRMLFRFVATDTLKSLNSLKSALLGNDDQFVQQVRNLYEQKKSDYEKDTGKELDMTEDEFIDLIRKNIKNQLLDALIFLGLLAIYFGLKANMPDDDEDPAVRNRWKFMLKATDKFTDEIAYFYNPTNITKLVSTGIFPSLGLIENYQKTLTNFGKEMFGLAIGDEELVEKNYVIKYLMKSFPITSQGAALLPMFFPEIAKDLGIRMPSQSGIR